VFIVSSVLELTNTIIPHYDNYPLITKKKEEFELFKEVVQIMKDNKHVTREGFQRVLSIKAYMRNGLTEALVETFPDVVPVFNPYLINAPVTRDSKVMETVKPIDPN
jgi:LAGLIDADG endonuclease